MKKLIVLMLCISLLYSVHAELAPVVSKNTIEGFGTIQVTLVNQEPDPVAPGNVVELKFDIENIGRDPLEDVDVRITPKFPYSLYGGESQIKSIGTLDPDQYGNNGVRVEYKIAVGTDAAEGENTVEFWYRSEGGSWLSGGDFDITIREREAILAINEISSVPEKISPGTISKVTFNLDNLADSVLKDVTLKLDVYKELATSASITYDELPFSPIGSGNEKTVKSIDAKSSEKVTFDLFTDADALSKVYKVPYTLTYADESGENFSRAGVVGLIVDAAPDLAVYIDNTNIYSAGSKGTLTVRYVNKGFSDIKFMYVVVQDTEQFDILSNQQEYLGNIDSDDYETADYEIIVDSSAKEGIMIPLRLEYRDANGALYEEQIDLRLPLYSGNDLKQRTDNGGGSGMGFIIILIIVGGGIWYYRWRKKKKKQK